MALKRKPKRQIAVIPAVNQNSDLYDTVTEWNFSEFDVQPTADTENEFPVIAQGYPISGFKEIKKQQERD